MVFLSPLSFPVGLATDAASDVETPTLSHLAEDHIANADVQLDRTVRPPYSVNNDHVLTTSGYNDMQTQQMAL